MTDDRDPSIPLPAHEARCKPSKPGAARTHCARGRATFPPSGGSFEDYSIRDGVTCSVLCPGYEDARSLRKQGVVAPPPRVHKAVRGI